MIRKPIIKYRVPIIRRMSIFNRTAVSTNHLSYDSTCDCKYSHPDTNEDDYSILETKYYQSNWSQLESQIWNNKNKEVLTKLCCEVDIPNEVLWALSYHSRNILQININVLELQNNLHWIKHLVDISGRCGIFIVFCLYPIIPTVTKSSDIIGIIDRYRNSSCHHFVLKFAEFDNCEEVNKYINFNGTAIPTKYLVETTNGWKCNDNFIKDFLEIIELYTVPRKTTVSIY